MGPFILLVTQGSPADQIGAERPRSLEWARLAQHLTQRPRFSSRQREKCAVAFFAKTFAEIAFSAD
jgi:hypothetical protein